MPVITDLSLTISPYTALYTQLVPDSQITASENLSEGRNAVVLDFNQGEGLFARDLGTTFQWPTTAGTILYVWQPSLIPQPEGIYNRATDWMDGGNTEEKFIQGVTIEADTFGQPKALQLQSADDLSLQPILEMPAVFNGQSIRSFSCAPFLAHSARVVSFDGVEWRVWSSSLVFEPYPSSCLEWSTELMNYGNGWQHVRMLNIPYIASTPVTVTLLFDQWPSIVLSNVLPATASQMYPTKQKVNVPANKSKLLGFTLSSTAPFRPFKRMLEVWVGVWGRSEPYKVVKPFGGNASDGAKV